MAPLIKMRTCWVCNGLMGKKQHRRGDGFIHNTAFEFRIFCHESVNIEQATPAKI